MNFYSLIKKYDENFLKDFIKGISPEDIALILLKKKINELDYLALLSPAASGFLEEMAQKAREKTRRFFGKSILLYTPIYLSDHCINFCRYCGFNASVNLKRSRLKPEELEEEAKLIAETGLKHILVLTGESRLHSSFEYIKNSILILSKYFSSIALEVYPLKTEEYKELVKSGVDSFTLYQETYNEDLYEYLHPKGPKRDYLFRLNTPERACIAGMRSINIGALLGLDLFYKEAFYTGLHAFYLQKKYPEIEISVSFPRIRPHLADFKPDHQVSDFNMVQAITALRLFMPRAGITISTRESREFRNNILPLGVTKMSASSSTQVGGRCKDNNLAQFDISDKRSVSQLASDLSSMGYQAVYKDWDFLFSNEIR